MIAVAVFWLPPRGIFGLSGAGLVNFEIFVFTNASIFAVALFLRSTFQRLRLIEQRLLATFNSVPAAIAAVDCNGQALVANEQYLSLFPTYTIPSRDPERVTRWRGWHEDGRPLQPDEFPGSRALRGESVLPGQEMIFTDEDGGEVWTRIATVPTRALEGEVSGFVTVITDISESKAVEAALRESENRLHTLIDGIPQLVWRAAPHGGWTWASYQWGTLTGVSGEASFGDGWLEALHPEDRAAAKQAQSSASEKMQIEFECRIRHRDTGEYRWFKFRAQPLLDGGGEILEWLGTCTDVHDLRELQNRQAVLVGELQHRTRNLIGVIGSMCEMTARSSSDYAEFRSKYRTRLDALARVQGLLSRLESDDRVAFDELLKMELTALQGNETAGKVSLSGPCGVRLRSSAVQTLAMALHELTTNALKYGALGQDGAALAINWALELGHEDDELWLQIAWTETGVQMSSGELAKGSGQGRALIEKALPYQLGARTAYEFKKDGVDCTIWIPISKDQSAVGRP